MSCQITLSTWSGESKTEAAEKLSRIFRLNKEKGLTIVEGLCKELPWQFENTISDKQASQAAKFLQEIGFSVDISPAESKVESLPILLAEPEPVVTSTPPETESSYRMGFQGNGGTLFGINFTNLIKTILTLGFYRFWAKTRLRQYIFGETLFAGDRFSYHGTAKELLRGAVRFGLFFIFFVVVSVYAFLEYGPIASELVGNIFTIIFMLVLPFLIVGAWRYRLSRTAWRGIRFSFRGQGREALTLYFKGYLLILLTLGLYWPYFKMETEKFWRQNSWFGNVHMRFSGKGKKFLKKFIVALFLTPLTLGFYIFWFRADLSRYIWSHTHIGGGNFHFPIKGRDYFKLKVANFFLIVLTLGLATSWVVVRNRKFIADHLIFSGNFELNQVVQEMQDSDAFGEESMDIMDVPVDIG
jgi:uncharacterized membrane protein YjgN (DUF898 family)